MGNFRGKSTGQMHRQKDVKRRYLVKHNLASWIKLNYKNLEDIEL